MRAYRHTASALLLALVLAAGGSVATPLWQAAAPTAVPVAVGGAATNVPPTATVRPRSTLADARFSTAGWRTDFGMSSLPLGEITPGGPGRGGIPPIDAPRFVTVTAANAWLKPREPVIVVARGALARAYPLQILIWHEIVDDDFGGAPLAVTFCPLCNTAIAFDRRLAGRVLDFGTTGNVRNPDLSGSPGRSSGRRRGSSAHVEACRRTGEGGRDATTAVSLCGTGVTGAACPGCHRVRASPRRADRDRRRCAGGRDVRRGHVLAAGAPAAVRR